MKLFKKKTLLLIYPLSFSLSANDNQISVMGRLNDVSQITNQYLSGIYVARDTYGMRANSVVASFQGNAESQFNIPVSGFRFAKSLGSYQDRDSVTLYVDNISPPFKSWELISKADYTPTSFTSLSVDKSKIKLGMLLDTSHNPKWSSYVVSVEGHKVTTAGWVNTKTNRMGTPDNGVGLVINPMTKIWVTNFNSFLPSNSRANASVIQENAIVNDKVKNPTAVNGLDTVILPQSRFGGTAAYLARPADVGSMQQWQYGFISQGAVSNFASTNSKSHAPLIGYLESSSARDGIVFNGKNIENSIIWKDGAMVVASIDPKGLISKFGYKTAAAKSSMQLSDKIARYIISAQNKISLVLPRKEAIFPGYTMKLTKVSSKVSDVIFTAGGVNINGSISAKITGGTWNKEAIFDGTYWYIY